MNYGALALLATLSGCAATSHGMRSELPSGAHYVATGSSFAAGAGIEPRKAGPDRCGRSARNYASLLAARLDLQLDDQSCNGARTSDLLAPSNELAAQLDAVGPETRLVTATIGGNDLNYVSYLFASGCGPDGMAIIGADKFRCPPANVPSESDYIQLEANMREIVRRVKARAPRARVIFVQYVAMVPDQPCDAARLPREKAAVARAIGRRLAEITARAARIEGAEVLPAEQLSHDHRPCHAEPWSVGTKQVPGDGFIWHPNARGHAAIAEALADRLGR